MQKGTLCNVIDNSGARVVKCIQVYKRSVAKPGNLLVVSIKKVFPGKKIKKGLVCKAVAVRFSRFTRRYSQYGVKYNHNSVVLLKKSDNLPMGTRINGSVFFELRKEGFLKLVSMASSVV
jgi:large subunit ribosomal protein L14